MPLTQGRPPVIVVDATVDRDRALRRVRLPDGWTRREGLALPDEPWDLATERWMCVGAVVDEAGARTAVEALLRGVGLVVTIEGASNFRLRVLDDLHHSGRVVPGGSDEGDGIDGVDGVAGHGSGGSAVALSAEDEGLLTALADGHTVEQAARLVMISARTAHRRLAIVRRKYGAANTTEAVALWLADKERDDRS